MNSRQDNDMESLHNTVERIHREFIMADAHLDLAYDVHRQRCNGQRKVIETLYLEDFRKGGINVIVCAVFVDGDPEMALKQAMMQIAAIYAELEESPHIMALCRTYNDMVKIVQEGKIALLLSLEGVEPLGRDLELLPLFYALGIRILGLCWSRRNYAADGALYTEVEEGQKGGLTNFGIRLVREAEKLGMLIDVTHLNDEGFQDVDRISENPIIASHSNCRAIHGTKRNLSDEQITAIAARNGVIGVNACSCIVAGSEEKATVETLVDHIDHIVSLVGVEHVGLGFDFCERIMTLGSFVEVNGSKIKAFDVIRGYGGTLVLTAALLKRRYSEEDIGKIYGKNILNVFKKVLA